MTTENINAKTNGKLKSKKAVPKKPDKKKLAAELKAKEKAKKDAIVKVPKGVVLPMLTEEQKQEKAVRNDQEYRALEKSVRKAGLRAGILIREMNVYELFKYLKSEKTGNNFKSLNQWMREASPVSYSGGYAQWRVAEKLLPLMPKEELEDIPDFARKLLARLPKLHLEKPDSPIRKAAKTQSKKELIKTIQKHAPEAHVEDTVKMEIDVSAAPVCRDALEAAKLLADVENDSEAFEIIAQDWLDSICQDDRFAHKDAHGIVTGPTNRAAAENLKKQRAVEEKTA